MITGDFNGRPLEQVIGVTPDIIMEDMPATRGDARLDLLATNFGEELTSISRTDRLETVEGIESDHDLVTVDLELSHAHRFTKIKISSRPYTQEGEDELGHHKEHVLTYRRDFRYKATANAE